MEAAQEAGVQPPALKPDARTHLQAAEDAHTRWSLVVANQLGEERAKVGAAAATSPSVVTQPSTMHPTPSMAESAPRGRVKVT